MKIRPVGLIQASVLLLSLTTLLGLAGSLSWFLDLFSHFRVQYFLAALVFGGALFALKSHRFASLAMAVAIVNLFLLLPLYRAAPEPSPSSQRWKAMLYNVNTQMGSPPDVVILIREIDPDLLVLEEIDARWIANLTEISQRYPYQILEPRPDNFGIGLWSKLPLSDSETVFLGQAEVPTLFSTVNTDHGAFQICATHPLPPMGANYARQRDEQLAALPGAISETLPVLLLGDLNTTPWGTSFRSLLKESGLQDSMVGYGIQTSWPTGNFFLRIPLDHVLHSPRLQIHDRWTGPDAGSDHLPVIVEFSIREDLGERAD